MSQRGEDNALVPAARLLPFSWPMYYNDANRAPICCNIPRPYWALLTSRGTFRPISYSLSSSHVSFFIGAEFGYFVSRLDSYSQS